MTPNRILILSSSKDSHGCAVDYALKVLGANPVLINTAEIASGKAISVGFDDVGNTVRIGDFQGAPKDVRSIWLRRLSKSYILPEFADPVDRKHIADNCRASLYGMLGMLNDRFPVNPLQSKVVNSLKIVQLQAAVCAGFRIPKTIVSNRYDDIASFCASVPQVCVKSYYAHGWRSEDRDLQAITSKLDDISQFDRRSYEVMPHIYQEYINKRFEHRLTIFGNYHASIRIDMSRLRGQAQVDWRSDLSYLSHVSPSNLPEEVIAKAKEVMRRCGLRFGTFDIAETSEGEYVFFEVNEAGQWLWIEAACPDVRLLQPFCEFLISADDGFLGDPHEQIGGLDAESVLGAIQEDSRYKRILDAEFPDRAEYLSEE
jgi:hypothetical protein